MGSLLFPPPHAVGPPKTRDQLRGAHDHAPPHDDLADEDVSIRIQPPLVSWIALFGGPSMARRAAKEGIGADGLRHHRRIGRRRPSSIR
jgi:hypothetical protein